MESSILSEVDDTSILRMVLSTCYWPALHSIGLSATPPAQRAGAQRLRAMARLRNFSHLPKSVWSLGYCRLAFLTLSSSHFDPEPTSTVHRSTSECAVPEGTTLGSERFGKSIQPKSASACVNAGMRAFARGSFSSNGRC